MHESSVAIRLHANDDVLIATRQLLPGTAIESEKLNVRDLIPPAHKVAAHDIGTGEAVRRYNQIIGFATADIKAGQHVHVHNLGMGEFERDYGIGQDAREIEKAQTPATFMGYRRPNGRVGTRNYIAIIASVNCSATVTRAIARHFTPERLAAYPNIDGVIALPHPLGCGMRSSGEGMDLLRRTLVGYARHPNFAGVVFVGLGCEQNQVAPLITLIGHHEPGMLQQIVMQTEGGTTAAVKKGIAHVEAMLDARQRLPARAGAVEPPRPWASTAAAPTGTRASPPTPRWTAPSTCWWRMAPPRSFPRRRKSTAPSTC